MTETPPLAVCVATGEAARPVNPPPTRDVPTSGTLRYTLTMTEGPVTTTLDPGRAPCTVNSFVSLARQGYFDQTRCHRLADSGIFVLQCGDPSGTGHQRVAVLPGLGRLDQPQRPTRLHDLRHPGPGQP